MGLTTSKLLLTLSKDVEIWHHFCVMKTSKTPLILGIDFLKHRGCRPEIRNHMLDFTTDGGQTYQVETHDGDELLNRAPIPQQGAVAENEEEPLVILVLVSPNSFNEKVLDVELDLDWTLNPAETIIMELRTEAQSKESGSPIRSYNTLPVWNKQRVFMMPTMLP